MKKFFYALLIFATSILTLSGCNCSCGKKSNTLSTPVVKLHNDNEVTWKMIKNASNYIININNKEITIEDTKYVFSDFGSYKVKVKAIDKNGKFKDSNYSKVLSFNYKTKITDGSIVLNATIVKLKINDEFLLETNLYPQSNQKIKFESCDSSVAIIENNKILAKQVGKTEIIVSSEGYKNAYCYIEVVPKIIVENGKNISIEKGSYLELDIASLPKLDNNEAYTFFSSNESIAFAGPTGIINALSVGECTITIFSSNGGKTVLNIQVNEVKPAIVTIEVTIPIALQEGETLHLVGAFNGWTPVDEEYKLTMSNTNPLVYFITVKTFIPKTDLVYKFIKNTSAGYSWEDIGGNSMANRIEYITGGAQTISCTIESWQPITPVTPVVK